MDMARCLLTEAQVHKRYWPEIICAAAYFKNRMLTNHGVPEPTLIGEVRAHWIFQWHYIL